MLAKGLIDGNGTFFANDSYPLKKDLNGENFSLYPFQEEEKYLLKDNISAKLLSEGNWAVESSSYKEFHGWNISGNWTETVNFNKTWGQDSWVNTTFGLQSIQGNYWALLLVVFPCLTLFGNVLVIMAVVRERTLQSATNYFIVSLAIADLLVAVLAMPFAVYVLVNGAWGLPAFVCDFYIATDVTCSTSSIFNLVAISIDRYIAVTKPIKYAKHKNTQRVWLTIGLVWVISAAIGSPIVLGLNNTPARLPDQCLFYSSDFILYSSLSSFYIPCIIMVFLYYNIFAALRTRARKQRATRRPHPEELLPGSVLENTLQTKRLQETNLGPSSVDDERPTNTGSGSNEEDADCGERSPGSDDIKVLGMGADECEIIPNDKSTEFILATVVEEAILETTLPAVFPDPNGNNDSGYAASNMDDAQAAHHSPPRRAHTVPQIKGNSRSGPLTGSTHQKTQSGKTSTGKDQKSSSIGSRFTIYKVNKASKKKREKSSAKKERKATQTLAIVLGVFLICWVPFFTCNILDALCQKLSFHWRPGVTAFILTTWLGYFNSFVNPVIYTIFNPEFRKAFKKIMNIGH